MNEANRMGQTVRDLKQVQLVEAWGFWEELNTEQNLVSNKNIYVWIVLKVN